MGGRVAEEISELLSHAFHIFVIWSLLTPSGIVYGAENVTSGASSDIRKATRTAQAMVKVSAYLSQPNVSQIF